VITINPVMKNIFIDTNVIIDFLADRAPFSEEAAQLFQQSLTGKLIIYVSALSFNNIYYIMRRQFSHKETIKMLLTLSKWTTIIEASKETVINSLDSDFSDFEDAIQYFTATSNASIGCIVTRNTKDFKKSKLPIMTPGEFLGL
jgi:predicted nucleic acid-binding protein